MKKLVGETIRFIYGIGGGVIAEYDGSSGNLKKEYVAGGGSLITIEPTAVNSNGAQYATTDHLGSPRVITNSSGSVVSRHDYMPSGEELGASVGGRTTGMGFSNSGDNNRKKFTGYERDTETGLDFAQARFYGSTQGRFTSPDPFSASAIVADPQTFNRYAYCRNNPVNSVDPSGMSAYAAMMSEGAQERRQATWQSGHNIIEEEGGRYERDLEATYAAIAEANYLNKMLEEVAGSSLGAPQQPSTQVVDLRDDQKIKDAISVIEANGSPLAEGNRLYGSKPLAT